MAKSEINLQSAFYMEPEEIVKYFESKKCKISFDWHEVYEDAHAKAFTVAKMTNADLLKDTHDMLTKAIKEGWSSSHFKREAGELFAKKGWTGHKEVVNPKTGETQTVELGTPRRIKQIFNCNMRSAYAVGRYKQQLEDVDFAPYFQYQCILDGKTRPEHKAMHGKVFRYDDEIWQSLYPPNGWNCRCFVRSLTDRQMERKGLKCESSDGKLKEIETLVGGEPKTITAYDFKANGKSFRMSADAGWGTNLGTKAWNLDVQAYKKIAKLPQDVQDKFISDMAQNVHNKENIQGLITKTIKNNLLSRGNEDVLTWFTPEIIKALEDNKIRLQTPVAVFEDRQVKHSLGDRKTLKQRLSEEQFLNIYDYVKNPDEVYLDTELSAIIYVKYLPEDEIIDERDCIKIPVQINTNKRKRPINYVGTTGRINHSDTFKNKRYKRIK